MLAWWEVANGSVWWEVAGKRRGVWWWFLMSFGAYIVNWVIGGCALPFGFSCGWLSSFSGLECVYPDFQTSVEPPDRLLF